MATEGGGIDVCILVLDKNLEQSVFLKCMASLSWCTIMLATTGEQDDGDAIVSKRVSDISGNDA